jgi:hypothetical protein
MTESLRPTPTDRARARSRRRGPAPLFAAALLLAATARAQPAPGIGDDVEIARAHFATGQAYYEHGRFIDAAREFEEAYRLSPKAPLLYNVGKAYDGASDFARALDAYRRFAIATAAVAVADTVDSADADFAGKRVQLLSSLVGRLTLVGARAGSTVQLDGAAAGTTPLPELAVNPGRHALAVAHEGLATFRAQIDVPVGGALSVAVRQLDSAPLVVTASAAPPVPAYKKWWLWTAAGGAVVVAGVIVAVVLTSSGSSGPPTLTLPTVK